MKQTLYLLTFLALTACGGSGGGSSTPSTENPEIPCQVDCSGDEDPQGEITYSHATNGNIFVADSAWNLEVPTSDADLTDSRMFQKSGEFSQAPKVGDEYTTVYQVESPSCGTGFSRDFMSFAILDNLDASEIFKVIHFEANNSVKIYKWETIVNNMTAYRQFTLETTDIWTCENGLMTLGSSSPQNTIAVNSSGFGYILYNTYSGGLYPISLSASPTDLTSTLGFNVIYKNSYYTGSDSITVGSGNPSPFIYYSSSNIGTDNIFNSFLGNSGNFAYIFGFNQGLYERSNLVILKNMEDKDLNTKNILIGVADYNYLTHDPNSSSNLVILGMTP